MSALPDPDPDAPLAGITVIDLSERIAGPYCTKLLADFGARVVKVERPGGDPARTTGPFRDDVSNPEGSGMFLHLNPNKESVVVDPSMAEGAQVVRDLVANADVVVESTKPGTLAGWGIGPDDLRAANPSLVVSSITPFGQTGPYRDYEMTEIVAYAMGGPMNASGVPDREPVKLAGNVVQMQSGATAAVATLGALYHSLETRVGQHVDTATFETQNGNVDRRRYYLLSYAYSASTAQRASVVGSARIAAGGAFEAADGLMVTTGMVWPDHVPRMVTVLDDEEITALWKDKGTRIMGEHAKEVNSAIAAWVSRRASRQAMREAQAAGWPIVVVNDPLLLLQDDHFVARGFWVEAAHPVAGRVTHTGAPWRIDGGGWALRRTAPLLGQDTDTVLRSLAGYDDERIAALRSIGAVA